MAFADLILRSSGNAIIGTVQFDCFITETHTSECDVTEHAVEDGADIADHIRKKPDTLQLRGIVSNSPIVFLASLRAPSPVTTDFKGPSDRAEAANRELDRIIAAGERIDVTTSLKEYSNMAITTKVVTRDAKTGNVLDVTVGMREIVTATTAFASIAKTTANAAKKAASDSGTKGKDAATDTQSSKATSVLGSWL